MDDSATLVNHQEILSAEETNETIENSVEFVLNRLNSNDNKIIIETIVQVCFFVYYCLIFNYNFIDFIFNKLDKKFDYRK